MTDTALLLKALDWLGRIGVPADLLETARGQVLNGPATTLDGVEPPSAADSSAANTGTMGNKQESGQSGDPSQRVLLEIVVDPSTASITPGKPQHFTATFEYSDGTTEVKTDAVVWSSDSSSIPIDAHGVATASAVTATAVITATDPESKLTGTAQVTVAPPAPGPALLQITVTPASPSIFANIHMFVDDKLAKPPLQFHATGLFADKSTKDLTRRVEWRSSDADALAIDMNGLATVGLKAAKVTISAIDMASGALGAAIGGSTTVTITRPVAKSIVINPQKNSIDIEEQLNFWVAVQYSDGTQEALKDAPPNVTWTATGAMGVDSDGLGYGMRAGPATLTAKESTSGLSATIQLTVEGVRSVPTPVGDLSYLVPSEGAVKPLVAKVVETLAAAEALNETMYEQINTTLGIAAGVGPIGTVLKEVAVYTFGKTKRDAGNAKTAQLLDDASGAFLRIFIAQLGNAKDKIKSAESHLKRSQNQEMIVLWQEKAREMDETTDEMVAVGKLFAAAPSAGHNPGELISAALDVFGAWAKANNPYNEAVQELQKENADDELRSAIDDLKSAREMVKKLEPELKKSEARVKDTKDNSDTQWQTSEDDYDNDERNAGTFRFSNVKKAIPAAAAAADAALKASSAGYAALSAARALERPDKKPEDWMANVQEDQRIIADLAIHAKKMYDDATKKHNDAKAWVKQFQDTYDKAREAMRHAPDKDF